MRTLLIKHETGSADQRICRFAVEVNTSGNMKHTADRQDVLLQWKLSSITVRGKLSSFLGAQGVPCSESY